MPLYANRANLTRNELLLRFNELEAVIRSPVAEGNLDKAAALVMYIARSARDGPIANLAMQAMSAIHLQKSDRQPDDGSLEKILMARAPPPRRKCSRRGTKFGCKPYL